MRKVYTARDVTDAGIIRGVLETNGIAVTIRGEHLFGARGLIPVSAETAPTVWVEESDYDRAKALIEGGHAESGPSWSCGQCGETVDHELGECWKCGTVRGS